MSNSFCRYLSNQARIEYGKLTPCCWFTKIVNIADQPQQAIKTYQQSLYSITNFESAGGACSECENRESKGLFSPRLESLKQPMLLPSDDDGVIKRLEIQIDKDCNGACLICGPWNSTTWEKYENKLKNIPIKDVLNSDINTEKFIDQITKNINFDQVEDILILGGEPLRTNSHLILLDKIKNPANTTVRYTTNGSYQPTEETLKVWKRFKEVKLAFSIDGIGGHFNYLRWPLQWNQIEDNLRFLLALKNTNVQIMPFSYTTTPFSLYYHDRYQDWATNFFKDTTVDPTRAFMRPWQPRGSYVPMSLSAVPENLAEAIRKKYGAEHSITKLLQPYSLVKNIEFKNYINHHDQHRGTDWRTVFPEMLEYFA